MIDEMTRRPVSRHTLCKNQELHIGNEGLTKLHSSVHQSGLSEEA